jgi:hypothetical protein
LKKMTVASGRALAALVLGLSLLKVLFLRAFSAFTGLPLFLQNYGPDRLPPVAPDERLAMAAFSRCVACGRCDVGEAERMRDSGGAYPGVMAFVLASSRSMPDHDAAVRALAWVPESVLAEKERHCPTEVPIVQIARFVRKKAALVAPTSKRLEAGLGRRPALNPGAATERSSRG